MRIIFHSNAEDLDFLICLNHHHMISVVESVTMVSKSYNTCSYLENIYEMQVKYCL